MVMALAPLHKAFTIKRLIISTYQSITGTGVKAVAQLKNESEGNSGEMAYPHPIHKNALPHCDVFLENDYTKEEMKLVHETHKILGDDTLGITATAIRIPVVGGHSECVNIEFEKPFEIEEIRSLLDQTPGVTVQDDPESNTYPMPIYAEGKDEVFVGRIRRDTSHSNAVNMWIVADNLRKGAATNTVQIAEYLIANEL
jgi:aspartate-semialdehyde dehydrogenase